MLFKFDIIYSLSHHICTDSARCMGIFTYYVIIWDLKNLVPFGHKELWRPLTANRGYCAFKDVVTSGHNELWRHMAAKFPLWLPENNYVISEQTQLYAIKRSEKGSVRIQPCSGIITWSIIKHFEQFWIYNKTNIFFTFHKK